VVVVVPVPLVVLLAVVVSPGVEVVPALVAPPDVVPVSPPDVLDVEESPVVLVEVVPVSVVPSVVVSGVLYRSLFALLFETSLSLHFTPVGQISEKCLTPFASNHTYIVVSA
jgi:hypothetical protein